MKTAIQFPLLFLAIFTFASSLQSCKTKEEDVVRLQNVVPQEIIDDLKAKGLVINEGNQPPKLNLSVRVSPMQLLVSYGNEDAWKKGHIIPDNFYKFYGQTDDQKIIYDAYQQDVHDGTGKGAFIVGANNSFTIFSQEEAISSGIPNKTVAIISGRLEGNTIKDFQHAFIITEKTGDDEDNVLIPVGTGRIWVDGDGVSESGSILKMPAKRAVKGLGPMSVE